MNYENLCQQRYLNKIQLERLELSFLNRMTRSKGEKMIVCHKY